MKGKAENSDMYYFFLLLLNVMSHDDWENNKSTFLSAHIIMINSDVSIKEDYFDTHLTKSDLWRKMCQV